MGEEGPDEGHSTLRDNSMTMLIRLKKGGHGTSLFYYSVYRVIGFLGLTEETKLYKPDRPNEPRRGDL